MKRKVFLVILLFLFFLGVFWYYGSYKHSNLLQAVLSEKEEDVSYFVDEKKYSPNETKYRANILFFYIISKQNNVNLNFIKFLLKKGFEVENNSSNHFSPIFAAVLIKNMNLVDLLIKEGANVNALYRQKSKPLSIALQVKDCKMARFLVEKGANLDGIEGKDGFEKMLAECCK